MDDGTNVSRADTKALRDVHEAYKQYLASRWHERSPRAAHMFALSMAHKGDTMGTTIKEIVLELEGQLAIYWTPPE
jgi:hypothetical protein